MTVEQQRRMQGTLKTFDKAEHGTYDKLGKDAFKKYLNEKLAPHGLVTIENKNAYGIDLITLNSNGEVVHCWEIEVRHGNWKGHVRFPFSDINCIERKDHQWRREDSFIKKISHPLASEYRVTYVQLNRECTRAVCIEDSTILEHKLIPWANRKSTGEYVRQVPISETSQLNLLDPRPLGY